MYGKVVALNGVSFAAERGEVIGLLGPNGAGKTTLLRILAGLILPTSGTVKFGDGRERLQRLVGYMPYGERTFYLRNTGRDNLEFFAATRRIRPELQRRRIKELSDRLELGAVIDRPVMTFSAGERQRLNLARALLSDPTLVLCDEPTANLDVRQADTVRMVLGELARDGKIAIVSSHNMSEVEGLCSHVVVLSRGKTVATGPIALLKRHSTLHLYSTTVSEPARWGFLAETGATIIAETATTVRFFCRQSYSELAPLMVRSCGATLVEFAGREADLEDIFRLLLTEEGTQP